MLTQVKPQPGKSLPEHLSCQTPKIIEILKTTALHETFWHQRLQAYQSIQLPYEVGQGRLSTQWTTGAWCELLPYKANDPRHTVLTVFAIYLARLTGQTRLQVGWHLQIEQDAVASSSTLALTVPMELDVDGDGYFSDVLERVKEELRCLSQHGSFTWSWVSRQSTLREIPGLQATRPWRIGISMMDGSASEQSVGSVLTLQIDSHGRFRWLYDERCLDAEVIRRMSEHLQEIGKAAKHTYQKPVKQLNLLPEAERTLLLKTWNATKTPYPDKICLHQLFEGQVERTPEAIALVHENQETSYAELNAQANRLAHRLIELGVGPDMYVAICVKRSPAMVVGLFAILKAGGTYLPLDPNYPSERLTHILADATPAIVLADATGCSALSDVDAAFMSRTVLDPNTPLALSDTNPSTPGLTSRHLAYLIYTSSSTGPAKGVMIEHRSICNQISALQRIWRTSENDRVLQFASLAFDMSVEEIFVALTRGSALVLRDDTCLESGSKFASFCESSKITMVNLPTAFWNQITTAQHQVSFPRSLRQIAVGGETINLTALNTWFKRVGPRPTLLNIYGPTEITINATAYEVSPDKNSNSIGRPVANTRIYLLDVHGEAVPLGAIGEMYIGGVGVARNYLNRPELAIKRFLPDPFSEDKDARMFKTGDLARYLPDGNLEFLGRDDHQVKIRGCRVKLGEIEACLIEHPKVREATVHALGDGGNKRLVAYAVAEQDELLAHSLREHLAAKLPEYMMPAAFVCLHALPLTPHGKIDRKALPMPGEGGLCSPGIRSRENI